MGSCISCIIPGWSRRRDPVLPSNLNQTLLGPSNVIAGNPRLPRDSRGWEPERCSPSSDPCSICLDQLRSGLVRLPCSHVYHVRCIITWFRFKCSCPYCLTPISPEQTITIDKISRTILRSGTIEDIPLPGQSDQDDLLDRMRRMNFQDRESRTLWDQDRPLPIGFLEDDDISQLSS